MTDAGRTIAERLAAAEPGARRAASTASSSGSTAEGRLRGARLDGRAIGPRGLAAIEVRGVTDDSRAVRPGALFVAIAGGARRRPRLRGRARPRRAPRRPSSSGRSPSVALPQLVVDAEPAGARGRGRVVVRRPEPRAGGGRDHRHGRQDDDLVPRRRPPSRPPGIRTGMIGTAATRIGGTPGAERRARDDARRRPGSRPRLRAMADGRRPRRGHRDHVARARARSRRRHRLRRGDPDQRQPRAPRVPRVVGGLPSTPSCRCSSGSAASRPAAPSQPGSAGRGPGSSTPTTRSAGRFVGVDPGGRRPGPHLRHGPVGRRPRHADRGGRPRPARRVRRRRRVRHARPAARRPVQRPQRARGGRPRRGGSASTRRRSATGWRRSRSCPGAWSASRPASRSGSSSTTPTARRRSGPCSTCWRRSPRRAAAASSRSSGRPGSATRRSGR